MIIQTANLMVERNVPVTFAPPPDEIAGSEVHEAPPADKPKDKPNQPNRAKKRCKPGHIYPFINPCHADACEKGVAAYKHVSFGNG